MYFLLNVGFRTQTKTGCSQNNVRTKYIQILVPMFGQFFASSRGHLSHSTRQCGLDKRSRLLLKSLPAGQLLALLLPPLRARMGLGVCELMTPFPGHDSTIRCCFLRILEVYFFLSWYPFMSLVSGKPKPVSLCFPFPLGKGVLQHIPTCERKIIHGAP